MDDSGGIPESGSWLCSQNTQTSWTPTISGISPSAPTNRASPGAAPASEPPGQEPQHRQGDPLIADAHAQQQGRCQPTPIRPGLDRSGTRPPPAAAGTQAVEIARSREDSEDSGVLSGRMSQLLQWPWPEWWRAQQWRSDLLRSAVALRSRQLSRSQLAWSVGPLPMSSSRD